MFSCFVRLVGRARLPVIGAFGLALVVSGGTTASASLRHVRQADHGAVKPVGATRPGNPVIVSGSIPTDPSTVYFTSGSADLSAGNHGGYDTLTASEVPASLMLPPGMYLLLAKVSYLVAASRVIQTSSCGLDVTSAYDTHNSSPVDQFFSVSVVPVYEAPGQPNGDYVLQGIAQLTNPGWAEVECSQGQQPTGKVLASLSAIQAVKIVRK